MFYAAEENVFKWRKDDKSNSLIDDAILRCLTVLLCFLLVSHQHSTAYSYASLGINNFKSFEYKSNENQVILLNNGNYLGKWMIHSEQHLVYLQIVGAYSGVALFLFLLLLNFQEEILRGVIEKMWAQLRKCWAWSSIFCILRKKHVSWVYVKMFTLYMRSCWHNSVLRWVGLCQIGKSDKASECAVTQYLWK